MSDPLRRWAEAAEADSKRLRAILIDQKALNAELVAALKPFAAEDKDSLIDTLGHISREHIARARAVIDRARGEI